MGVKQKQVWEFPGFGLTDLTEKGLGLIWLVRVEGAGRSEINPYRHSRKPSQVASAISACGTESESSQCTDCHKEAAMLTVIQDGEWFVVRDTLANEDVIRFPTYGEALHLIDEIQAAVDHRRGAGLRLPASHRST